MPVPAASCSSSDVQAALNSVTQDGVTVTVPPGTCTWTTPVVPPCHSITLQGAGQSNGTTIVVNIASGYGNDAYFVSGCSGKQMRVTEFDWQNESVDSFGVLMFTGGTGLSVRIDHNTFEPFPGAPGYGRAFSFRVPCASPGCVADHNTFLDQGLLIEKDQPKEVNPGDAAWAQSAPFETINAFYIEDNTMNYPHFATHQVDIDCDTGGAYVFRHNTVIGNAVGNHGYDSVPNGCPMQDVYLNTINPNSVSAFGIQYRGGTGVAWSNVFTGVATQVNFGITNYRSNSNGFVGATGNGHCDGTNAKDGNADPSVTLGWPCYEQIGRTSGSSNGGLISQPLYEWDNCQVALGCTGTANQITATVYNAGTGTNWTPLQIVQNRDFYDSESGGCSGDQSTGVCIGLLSERPLTCTPGVGFWATDKQTLYRCESGNAWAIFYQPFTYPHPLVGP